MVKKPATILTKIRALWSDEAADRVLATKLHTAEWRARKDHIPNEELPRRFPYAKQSRKA